MLKPLLLSLALTLPAAADSIHWINPAGGNFEDAGNWSSGTVPGAEDIAGFNLPAPINVTLNTDAPLPIFVMGRGDVTLQAQGRVCTFGGFTLLATDPAVLRINGGTLTLRSTGHVGLDGDATLELNDCDLYGPGRPASLNNGCTLRLNSSLFFINTCNISDSTIDITNGGSLDSNNITTTSPSSFTISGPDSNINGDGLSMRGSLTLLDGASAYAVPGAFTAIGLTMTAHGQNTTIRVNGEATSPLTIGSGAQAQFSTLRAPVLIQPGATFVGGAFYSNVTVAPLAQIPSNYIAGPLRVDETSLPAASGEGFTSGLTADLDGLSTRTQPFLTLSNTGSLQGPLTVTFRNANALRVGRVIPLVSHPTRTFSSTNLPDIGGGRVLTITPPPNINLVVQSGGDPCWSSDFNGDGDFGTDQDIEAFFACLGGQCCPTCGPSDFNSDGDFGTDQDIEAFFKVLAGHIC
jgi:hypothetical protein